MGLQAALAGAQLLGGLLSKPKKYGSAADVAAGRTNLQNQANIGAQYGSLATGALNNYGTDNAGYRGAVKSEADYLREDPFTDSRDAADLATATNGSIQAGQRASSGLTTSLARRGFDPNSSMLAGGLTSLAGQQEATVAGAQNQLANRKIATRQANMGALTSLLGNESGVDYSRGTSALNAQDSIDGSVGRTYLGLGQQEQGQEAQAEAQRNQQIYGGASGLATAYTPTPKINVPGSTATVGDNPGTPINFDILMQMLQKVKGGTPMYGAPDLSSPLGG